MALPFKDFTILASLPVQAKMSTEALFFKTLLFFFFRIPVKQLRNLNYLHKKVSNIHAPQFKFQKSPSFVLRSGLTDCDTLVFNVEGTLLKSSSLFPYFMLVTFEAGSLLRALVLFLLYPFTCLVSEEMGIKMMVMICFFGIKKASFRAGSAVLPKFFLEDVGMEGFEMLRRGRKKVAVSGLPRVMIEGFLRDYLEVDIVAGRELKVVGGYFVGLMEEKKKDISGLEETFGDDQKRSCSTAIGIDNLNRPLAHHFFSHCKDVYLMSEADRTSWRHLPGDKYTKPLIFHDGRLALRPTLHSTLAMFMWVPFGSCLAIFRIVVALSLPNKISVPILAFSGLRLKFTAKPKGSSSVLTAKQNKPKGLLYVCNHRTLLDPLYISFALSKPVTAVTYSLSRLSELLAPIKTVRLTRDRDQDGNMMDKLLNQGDLVVCPEGTTCREPYLLRFSPLFSELSDDIIPVAMDSHVSMFHGTTAGGLKCLDPLFFLMNPCPSYNIQFLEKVPGVSSCHDGGESRYHVANHVQSEIGKALGFECTRLTRRDKYLTLAGNEGIVASTGITKPKP